MVPDWGGRAVRGERVGMFCVLGAWGRMDARMDTSVPVPVRFSRQLTFLAGPVSLSEEEID